MCKDKKTFSIFVIKMEDYDEKTMHPHLFSMLSGPQLHAIHPSIACLLSFKSMSFMLQKHSFHKNRAYL
jgi:hypothetical protein